MSELKDSIIHEYISGDSKTYKQVAQRLNTTWNYVKKVVQNYKRGNYKIGTSTNNQNITKQNEKVWDESGNKASWSFIGKAKINNLDEALLFSKVDLSIWKVQRHIFNTWTTTVKNKEGGVHLSQNVQIKIWFIRKVEEIGLRNIKESLVAEMKRYSPIYTKNNYSKKNKEGKNLAEINIFDLHFNSFSWAYETGSEYNIKIAKERFISTIDELIEDLKPYNIYKILFPIGNDLLTADNFRNTTTKGTPQDVCIRHQDAFSQAVKMLVEGIDKLRNIAPIDILIIPGNHDMQSSYYIGEILSVWYRKCKDVKVDNSPKIRKYYFDGVTLLGFTHGRYENFKQLPLLMAQECPNWSKAKYKEIHIGDKHRLTVNDFSGVRVRIIPSLSDENAWATERGYLHWKAAECFLWDKEKGFKANFSVNV